MQIRLYKDATGIPNVAFARYYAYSGVAALEALAHSSPFKLKYMKRCNLFLRQLCMHEHKVTYSTATLRLSMIFISDKPPPD